ncbi:MAG: SUMF1/EgtB/PvdO family nonheme iron enzyme [Deltaproteobacteria bacterium]|nr:SUMF1/EgtB/PvdO family nonheme iron enzyme [Deltaproteobacteria bacterium]
MQSRTLIIIQSALIFMVSCVVTEREYRSNIDDTRYCEFDTQCELSEICSENGKCIASTQCLSCSSLPHALSLCYHGLCLVGMCEENYHDINGLYHDGCEYECAVSEDGIEICDGYDNDCDGRIDEDTNILTDPLNCGECDNKCPVYDNSEALCVGGNCYFSCVEGYYDVDGIPGNGCESTECVPTADGVEICDLRDNNCNGVTDEGIIKDSPDSCGPLCTECNFPNSVTQCIDGGCEILNCLGNCQDLNGKRDDGCEYCCEITAGGVEICDGIDNDCNGYTDEGLLCECPDGMALINDIFCIDKYEASRPDATFSNPGTDNSMAQSVPDVIPWTNTSLQDASDACQNAGKRLCTPEEWELVCRGTELSEYSYGNDYNPTTCNGIDSFCFCGPGSSCESADVCPFAHCYQTCGASFHYVQTGQFPDCTNSFGVFDINGNVWERVQGGAGRGGAYNCSDSERLHKCSYIADWGTSPISNFGFRCCFDGD